MKKVGEQHVLRFFIFFADCLASVADFRNPFRKLVKKSLCLSAENFAKAKPSTKGRMENIRRRVLLRKERGKFCKNPI